MNRLPLLASPSRLLLTLALPFAFQVHAACPMDPLTPPLAGKVVDQLNAALDQYAIAETRPKVKAALAAKRPTLAAIADCAQFTEEVNRVLREASNDLHLRLRLNETPAPGAAPPGSAADGLAREVYQAYGMMAVRRLPGNIGYLKLRYFSSEEASVAMIDAALGLLKGADALILDFRENTGGREEAQARLLGHLAREPIPMVTIHWQGADGKVTRQDRKADVPRTGPLFADKPVYVLTAKRTFSAAEEVAYDLKAVGRAKLIGETTRGGANPSAIRPRIDGGFSAFIPNGRTVHPLTQGNWEGVGVAPDVAVAPEKALVTAYTQALAAVKPAYASAFADAERAKALADPAATLAADQLL